MKVFIDTNILVYAQDNFDEKKTKKARTLIEQLTENKQGVISTQVVQEFSNVLIKKSAGKLDISLLPNILDDMLFPLLSHTPDGSFYKRAINTYSKYSLSFYDALIVQAAIDLKCELIYSEDMQNGAHYDGVTIANPFI
jgi:predicted nucleic acid-binding protein